MPQALLWIVEGPIRNSTASKRFPLARVPRSHALGCSSVPSSGLTKHTSLYQMMPPALEKTTDGPMDVVGKGHDDSPLGLTVRSAFEVPIRASECSSDDTFSISSREIVMAPRRRSLSFASGLSRSSASFSASRSASKAISEVIRNGLTRVSDRMAEQHKMHGLSDLCKVLADDVFVPVTALRHIKYLGEGAFAGWWQYESNALLCTTISGALDKALLVDVALFCLLAFCFLSFVLIDREASLKRICRKIQKRAAAVGLLFLFHCSVGVFC